MICRRYMETGCMFRYIPPYAPGIRYLAIKSDRRLVFLCQWFRVMRHRTDPVNILDFVGRIFLDADDIPNMRHNHQTSHA